MNILWQIARFAQHFLFHWHPFSRSYSAFPRPFLCVFLTPLMKPKKHSPRLTTNLGNVDRRGFSSFKCNYVLCVSVWVGEILFVSYCVGMSFFVGKLCLCVTRAETSHSALVLHNFLLPAKLL